MPRRLAAALRNRLEGTKENGLVLALCAGPRAPLEAAVGDRQHVERNRAQAPPANLSGEPKQRRVIAQLLSILCRPTLNQRLSRSQRARIVIEAGHQRCERDDTIRRA